MPRPSTSLSYPSTFILSLATSSLQTHPHLPLPFHRSLFPSFRCPSTSLLLEDSTTTPVLSTKLSPKLPLLLLPPLPTLSPLPPRPQHPRRRRFRRVRPLTEPWTIWTSRLSELALSLLEDGTMGSLGCSAVRRVEEGRETRERWSCLVSESVWELRGFTPCECLAYHLRIFALSRSLELSMERRAGGWRQSNERTDASFFCFRSCSLMEKARLAKEAPRGKETEVYVMSVGDGLVKERMQICKQLWDAGIKVSRSSSRSFPPLHPSLS